MGPDRTARRKPPENGARGRIERVRLVPCVSEQTDIHDPIRHGWGRIINTALRVRRLPQASPAVVRTQWGANRATVPGVIVRSSVW